MSELLFSSPRFELIEFEESSISKNILSICMGRAYQAYNKNDMVEAESIIIDNYNKWGDD